MLDNLRIMRLNAEMRKSGSEMRNALLKRLYGGLPETTYTRAEEYLHKPATDTSGRPSSSELKAQADKQVQVEVRRLLALAQEQRPSSLVSGKSTNPSVRTEIPEETSRQRLDKSAAERSSWQSTRALLTTELPLEIALAQAQAPAPVVNTAVHKSSGTPFSPIRADGNIIAQPTPPTRELPDHPSKKADEKPTGMPDDRARNGPPSESIPGPIPSSGTSTLSPHKSPVTARSDVSGKIPRTFPLRRGSTTSDTGPRSSQRIIDRRRARNQALREQFRQTRGLRSTNVEGQVNSDD